MLKTLSFTLGISIALFSMTGCQVVNVKQQKLGTTLSNERDSILTRNKLSEASLNMLAMTGRQAEQCTNSPENCMGELQQIPEILDEQLLSTGSEIFLSHALQLEQSSQCNIKNIQKEYKDENKTKTFQTQYDDCINQQLESLNQSIRYSYAYLFASKRPPQQRLFDNRQVQVRDFYNQAIANLVNAYNENHKQTNFNQQLKIGNSFYQIDLSQYPNIIPENIEQLISTYNLSFSGLKSISRRDGFGSEFAIQIKEYLKKPFDHYMMNPFSNNLPLNQHPNIHAAKFLPATIVIEPNVKNNISDILSSKNFKIKLIDPNAQKNIKIANQEFPLAANFSAPYGLWLANNNLGAAAYWTLIDREQDIIMPHLFMLEPYNPKKKIIIMVHGLASSPEAWIAMTNDIMGDAVLRDNFQVWQVFYSTNMPIVESRYQIYALLKQTFDYLNQQYPAQPPRNAVLLGHSMGGVISRLLVSNQNFTSEFLSYIQKKNPSEHRKLKDIAFAESRLKMQSLTPEINRAIFVSSPLQGTDYADRWFTLAARKIIKLPQSFLTATFDTISHGFNGDITTDYLRKASKELLQNGPSDLSKKSMFMQITKNAEISSQIKYHVIIGNNTDSNDNNIITDGIVPYYSAHLENAESEKIIKGGHSIQYSPEAILELRRILRLHLVDLDKY